MTLGVILPRDLPAPLVLPFARRAEELGFDQLWTVEDLSWRGGIAQTAAVLAVTERIRVGVGVLPTGARNVAFAAMEAASLAELFPGRIDLGIGHGTQSWMRQIGAGVASPLTLLREYTAALRELLAGQEVSTQGRYVQLDRVRLTCVPDVPPPVLLGVRGPKSLQVSGATADGTILAEPVPLEYLSAARRTIAAPGEHRVVAYQVAAVGPDSAAAVDAVRPGLEWIGEPDWAPHLAELDIAAEFAALRASCADRAEFTRRLPADWIRRLAVTGTPDEARSTVDGLLAAGADSVVLTPIGDPMAALESLGSIVR